MRLKRWLKELPLVLLLTSRRRRLLRTVQPTLKLLG
jgi:hypothetical protein